MSDKYTNWLQLMSVECVTMVDIDVITGGVSYWNLIGEMTDVCLLFGGCTCWTFVFINVM